MKLFLIPVWASLVAESAHAHAATTVVAPALLAMPEPSSIAMLIVGLCAVGVGLSGRLRRRPE